MLQNTPVPFSVDKTECGTASKILKACFDAQLYNVKCYISTDKQWKWEQSIPYSFRRLKLKEQRINTSDDIK